MKLLQINTVGQTGSTGRTCRELAEYLNQTQEHSCYTAVCSDVPKEYGYRIGTDLERKLHSLLSRLTCRQGWFSKKGTERLLRYIDALQPDVVHLRNLHGNYIHYPMLLQYLAQKDIPTVITLHDCWFFTGKCCHYTVDGCFRWQTGCHDCPRLKKDNPSWFVDATAKNWRAKKELFEQIPRLAVTGVSDWITGEARRSFLSCAKEITRIYNWIDLDVFYPRDNTEALRKKLGVSGKKVVLAVASTWSQSKGFNEISELADRLGEDHVIVLVGKLKDETKLPSNILPVRETDSVQELTAYYSMADVFITMSPEESFGKVSAEAVACGTPVVCWDSTANRELVGEGCGEAVKLYDMDAFENAVHRICAGDRAQYIRRCRAFAESSFAKQDRIAEYLSLYERICK